MSLKIAQKVTEKGVVRLVKLAGKRLNENI